jgi:hypothetical protein
MVSSLRRSSGLALQNRPLFENLQTRHASIRIFRSTLIGRVCIFLTRMALISPGSITVSGDVTNRRKIGVGGLGHHEIGYPFL